MPRRRRQGGGAGSQSGAGAHVANEVEDEVSAFHNARNAAGDEPGLVMMDDERRSLNASGAGRGGYDGLAPVLDLSGSDDSDSEPDDSDMYSMSSDDEAAERREDAQVEKIGKEWGTKRDAFYKEGESSGDEAEDDQEDEEAEAFEGKEVVRMQRDQAKRVSANDFALGDDSSDEDEDSHDDDDEQTSRIVLSKSSRRKNKMGKNAAKVAEDAPELEFLLSEFKSKLKELDGHIHPVLERVYGELETTSKDGISYVETKNMLLLNYCVNLSFYLLLKASGKSVKDHPVIAQLVRIRTMLDKLRPLDQRLKSQIDQLLDADDAVPDTAAAAALKTKSKSKAAGPDLSNLMSSDDDDDDEEEGGQEDGDGYAAAAAAMSKEGKYVVPKMSSMPFEESERSRAKRERREAKLKSKLNQNRMLRDMRNEFSEKPVEESAIGVSGDVEDRRAHEKALERRKYEEDNFVRLVESKQEKKERLRRERAAQRKSNNFADIDQFRDLDVLVQRGGNRAGDLEDDDDLEGQAAYFGSGKRTLSQYVNEMEQRQHSNEVKAFASSGDHMPAAKDPFHNPINVTRKRDRGDELAYDKHGRRVSRFGGNIDNDELIESDGEQFEENETYLAAKRQNAARKKRRKDKYLVKRPVIQAAPLLEEGEKRRASRKILKNKGLHAHKKKTERNPRVKMRKKFEKKMKARKGQVREMRTGEAAHYGGESSGIRANVSRSRKPNRK